VNLRPVRSKRQRVLEMGDRGAYFPSVAEHNARPDQRIDMMGLCCECSLVLLGCNSPRSQSALA